MSETGQYCTVTRNDEGEVVSVEVEEGGYITKDTVSKFKYVFSPPNDITESLSKSKNGQLQNVSTSQAGRVSYSNCTVNYPDGTTATTMVLTDCVFQYRAGLKEESDYGKGYVTVGIPIEYGSEFIKHARSSAAMDAGFKGSECEGYYWTDMDLKKLTPADVQIITIDSDGEGMTLPFSISDALESMKSSVAADIICNINASATTKSMNETINPKTAVYNIKPKPLSIYLKKEIAVKGPQLALRRAKDVEKVMPSGSFAAAGALAQLAMQKLKLADN